MHISQIENKMAYNLATIELPSDAYHINIQRAACFLVTQNKGDYEYVGQTKNGTIWKFNHTVITVKDSKLRKVPFGNLNIL